MDHTEREIFNTLFDDHSRVRDPQEFRADLQAMLATHGRDVLNDARNERLDGLVLRAVRDDNHDGTRALLEAGIDANQYGASESPLHVAAALNQHDDVKLLLEHHADVTLTDAMGRTALHHAAANETEANLRTLLDHGAAVDAIDRNGDTPLAIAVRDGAPGNAHYLLKRDADPALAKQGQAWRVAEAHVHHTARNGRTAGEVGEGVTLIQETIVERERDELRQAMRDAPAPVPTKALRQRL